ncbi:MAG: DNA double-strand break repair nuclease NurA [Candidatus Jordarchaeum sp.]|uniref:DNA double-strand break repair nuclease NurA n=1 Tax=Candidatus Jordarchaeum sp. TaxID=2823881 RepID=UPI00404AA4BC
MTNLLKFLEAERSGKYRSELFHQTLDILESEVHRFYDVYLELIEAVEGLNDRKEIDTLKLRINPAAKDAVTQAVDGSSNRSQRAGLDLIVVSAAGITFKCNNPVAHNPYIIGKCIPVMGLVDEDVERIQAISRQYLERLVTLKALDSSSYDLVLLDGPFLPHYDLLPYDPADSKIFSNRAREVQKEYRTVFEKIYGNNGTADMVAEKLLETLHAFVIKSPHSMDFISNHRGVSSWLSGVYGRINDANLLDSVLPPSNREGFHITTPQTSKLWSILAQRKIFGPRYSKFLSEQRFFYIKPHQDALPIRVEVHKGLAENEKLLEYLCSAIYYQASNLNNVPWSLEFAHAFSLIETDLPNFLADELLAKIVKIARKNNISPKKFYRLFKPKHGLEVIWNTRKPRGV